MELASNNLFAHFGHDLPEYDRVIVGCSGSQSGCLGSVFEISAHLPLLSLKHVVVLHRLDPGSKRQLDNSLIVCADAALWDFIHSVHEQSYRLVGADHGICLG